MKAQASDIGTILHPIDNSYSECIEGIDPHIGLAGSNWEDSKPVKIVSGPYKMFHESILNTVKESEFITVLYQGKLYRMLNYFSKEMIKAGNEGL